MKKIRFVKTTKQKRVIVATVRPIKTFDNWKFSNNNSRKRRKKERKETETRIELQEFN